MIISKPFQFLGSLIIFILMSNIGELKSQSVIIKLPIERREAVFEMNKNEMYLQKRFGQLEFSSLPKGDYLKLWGGHPLLTACQEAYAFHQGFTLSPEVFWVTVLQGAALHIQLNERRLKDKFTGTENKITIALKLQPDVDINWSDILSELTKNVLSHIPVDWASVAHTTFSTTSALHQNVFNLAFLDVADSYFTYEGDILCGIPEVKITGKEEDWQLIKTQIQFLSTLDMNWWLDDLNRIIDQILATYEGKIEEEFWCTIFKIKKDGCKDPYITGWITKLIPYVKQAEAHDYTPNKTLVNPDFSGYYKMDNFPIGSSEITFTLNKVPYRIAGGIMGSTIDSTRFITPQLGFIVQQKEK